LLASNEAQLAADYTKVDPESHVRTVAGMPAISLRPVREDPNAICSVTWHSLLTMPEEDSDITSFGGPTVGLTIHLSEIPDDMTFVVGDGPNIRHVPNSLTWEYEDGFIHGQHVRVWWFKKQPGQ
jgi:hypothetical protein